MARAADISYMSRNGFLYQPTTNKEMSDKKKNMLHDFPEELQITAIMCSVQEAPATRQANTDAIEIKRNTKQESDNLVNREGLEKSTDEFIKCLIHRHMWDSDWRWKTAGEVKNKLYL